MRIDREFFPTRFLGKPNPLELKKSRWENPTQFGMILLQDLALFPHKISQELVLGLVLSNTIFLSENYE